MPLETGTWTINQSGTLAQLTITSVDAAGNVSGTLLAAPISGLWNEVLQKLTFLLDRPHIGRFTGFDELFVRRY
jgi:hypothetical protein